MKKLSSGSKQPSYTLYLPLVMHRLSRPIDIQLLAKELSQTLSTEVAAYSGSGWEQLRMGPFATETQARQIFNRTIRHLTTLCIQNRYPIYFDFELTNIQATNPPMTIYPDSPIDAWANLASAVIVPEHLHVYDAGVMLANIDPQMTTQQLVDAIATTNDLTTPIDSKLSLAVQAYISACATHSFKMKFVGFVICLEAMCEQEARSAAEIAALEAIRTEISKTKIAEIDPTREEMVTVVLNTIDNARRLSIGAQFQKLILAHGPSISGHLGPHPWSESLVKAAKTIYKMRSKIVHEGRWNADHVDIDLALRFAHAAAKAVLLDKLGGTSDHITFD